MKYKNIKEICREIDLIIEKKDNKNDYKYLYSDMLNVLMLPEMQYDVISENNDASKMENSDA